MKRALVCLLVLVGVAAFGAEPEDFSQTVAYDVGLPEIFRAVQAGREDTVDTERFILIQGAVASRTVINPSPETFEAELILIDGKWEDVVEVFMYMGKVVVRGPDFARRIPFRRTRTPPPNEIELNQLVLIAAKFIGVEDDPDTGPIPVFEGFFVRSAE